MSTKLKSTFKKVTEVTAKKIKLLFTKPNPKKISYINFAITYECNSRCKHCNIWRKYKENKKIVEKELKLAEIEKIFEESQYLKNIQSIGLTGGEPFLRNDFIDLCGFFIKKYPNAIISIPTNALLPDLIIAGLEKIIDKFGLENSIFLSISLDGIEKTHDEIRGMPGNYSCVLKLIDLLKKKVPSINRGISFTVMPQNYKDLLEVYKFSKKNEIDFGFQFAQISESFYGNTKDVFVWNEKKLDEVGEIINSILKEHTAKAKILKNIWPSLFAINKYYMSHMVSYQKNPHRTLKCYSGTHSLFIDPYGNIFSCVMLNKKFGNIREINFDKLWLSEKAQNIRKFIKEKKCACWTPCETHFSLDRDYKIILWNFYKILKRI